MSIAPHRTYPQEGSPPAYRKARDRVFGRPPNPENSARWLLSLSFTSTEQFSVKNWNSFLWEGFAFAHPDEFPTMDGKPIRSLPSKTDFNQMQNWVGSLWKNLEKGEPVYIKSDNWLAELHAGNDRIMGFASPKMSSWSESFKFQTFQVLTEKNLDGRFRFCKSNKCRRPFLSIKRQLFCSVSCSQRHRTSQYRNKNRELFREKRRQYYAQKQRERTGLPNLRIQSRKGARP